MALNKRFCFSASTCSLLQQAGSRAVSLLTAQQDFSAGSWLQHDGASVEAATAVTSLLTNAVSSPVITALIKAAIGLYTAISGPIRAYVTATESTLVSGVDIKNDTVASFDAPERCNPIAAGRTPQEHNGKGAPNKAALETAASPLPPTQRCMVSSAI
jgi:hypothetical protein